MRAVVVSLMVLGASVGRVHAQTVPSVETGEDEAPRDASTQAARTAEALQLFHLGLEHVDNDELAEALDAFSRSIALMPRVSTALNLALALSRMGQPIEAVAMLREIAAGHYGPVNRRLHLAPHIQRVALLIGTLNVATSSATEGTLPNVEILVDGVARAEISAPGATSFEINPGDHVITATAPDHEAARRTIHVAAGREADVSLRLERLRDNRPGTLTIETSADARIDVEGHGTGIGSLRLELPPRSYRATVTGAEGSDESIIEVPAGRALRIHLEPPTRTIWESPWLWVGVGVVLAAVASVVIWYASQTQRAPIDGAVFDNIEALRWGP